MSDVLASRRERGLVHDRARRGLTITELLVTMVIAVIIGGVFTRMLIHQSRFFDAQNTQRQARSVSRGAINVMLSELRMVTVPNGVLAVDKDSVVVRVPYAMGVLCASAVGASTISLAPMDSLAFSEGGVSGYAWRDSTGNYAYENTGFSLATGVAATCDALSITTLPGGKVVTVAPVVPTAAVAGTPVFLYRRIKYKFMASQALPGRYALWRFNLDANTSEELVSPFDVGARFRFFVDGSTTAQPNTPSPLSTVRGLELRLTGASDHARMSTGVPATAELRTSVFFMNRLP